MDFCLCWLLLSWLLFRILLSCLLMSLEFCYLLRLICWLGTERCIAWLLLLVLPPPAGTQAGGCRLHLNR